MNGEQMCRSASVVSQVFLKQTSFCNESLSLQGVQHLGPATDFYKKLALDCSGQQIGVDLFLLSSQYADLASLCKNIQHFSLSMSVDLCCDLWGGGWGCLSPHQIQLRLPDLDQ